MKHDKRRMKINDTDWNLTTKSKRQQCRLKKDGSTKGLHLTAKPQQPHSERTTTQQHADNCSVTSCETFPSELTINRIQAESYS